MRDGDTRDNKSDQDLKNASALKHWERVLCPKRRNKVVSREANNATHRYTQVPAQWRAEARAAVAAAGAVLSEKKKKVQHCRCLCLLH